jgi:hypothetical protein
MFEGEMGKVPKPKVGRKKTYPTVDIPKINPT